MDLVTGATGLIGGNLIRALADRGRRVRVMIRPTSPARNIEDLPDLDVVHGDVTDLDSTLRACDGIEHVYHCAALISMWRGARAAVERVNVEGTQNVIEACRRASAERLIHCSSVDAVGLSEAGASSDENTPWNWDRLGLENPYTRSKLEAQTHVLEAVRRGLDAVVVNPSFTFGPWDPRPSSGEMIVRLARGKLGGVPSGVHNFVAAKDVVIGMIAAAERGKIGNLYILGHENLSYRDALTRIASVLGCPPPRTISHPLGRVAGRIGDWIGSLTGREPPIHSGLMRSAYAPRFYNSAKAVRELGLPQTPLEVTAEETVRWFRDEGMIS